MEINKKIMVLAFASISMQLTAMQEGEANINAKLFLAARENRIEEAKQLLDQGVDTTYLMPVFAAASNGHVEMSRLLIEHGFREDSRESDGNTLLIDAAAARGICIHDLKERSRLEPWAIKRLGLTDETIWMLLTIIPPRERKKILEGRDSIIACELSLQHGRYAVKDVRKLISKAIIECYVDEQMGRIEKLILMQNDRDETAFMKAKKRHRNPEIIQLLDPSNQDGQNRIRNEVRKNIIKIMFDDQGVKKIENKRECSI